MIKIAIVDDDKRILDFIETYILEECNLDEDIEIARYEDAEVFLQVIQQGVEFDVLISDIEMPRISGLKLGKTVNQLCSHTYIIFLTSYSQYAAESYTIEAYQYILKRDLEERFPSVLERLLRRIRREKRQYRMIGTPTKKDTVYYRDIVYICKEKGAKYVKYVTMQEDYKERITLNQLIEELHSGEFVMADRSYIVNINHIESMHGNAICMDNGEQIISSRSQCKRVKEQINLYRGSLE